MKFLIYGLAVWRLSYMLVKEDGPGRIFRDLREATGIKHDDDGAPIEWNDITPLHCVYCTSLWVAALLGPAPAVLQWVLAGSGLAVMIDKITALKLIRIVNNSG